MPQVIITDLTEMSTGNYCVAGWDWEHQRMVRLLTRFGGNWTNFHVGQTDFGIVALFSFKRLPCLRVGHFHMRQRTRALLRNYANLFAPKSLADDILAKRKLQHRRCLWWLPKPGDTWSD